MGVPFVLYYLFAVGILYLYALAYALKLPFHVIDLAAEDLVLDVALYFVLVILLILLLEQLQLHFILYVQFPVFFIYRANLVQLFRFLFTLLGSFLLLFTEFEFIEFCLYGGDQGTHIDQELLDLIRIERLTIQVGFERALILLIADLPIRFHLFFNRFELLLDLLGRRNYYTMNLMHIL